MLLIVLAVFIGGCGSDTDQRRDKSDPVDDSERAAEVSLFLDECGLPLHERSPDFASRVDSGLQVSAQTVGGASIRVFIDSTTLEPGSQLLMLVENASADRIAMDSDMRLVEAAPGGNTLVQPLPGAFSSHSSPILPGELSECRILDLPADLAPGDYVAGFGWLVNDETVIEDIASSGANADWVEVPITVGSSPS